MKKKIILPIIIGVICFAVYSTVCAQTAPVNNSKVTEALNYCKNNGFNTDYCFLVDFSQTTHVKRFLVYDFNKQKVVYSAYCAHGNDGTKNSGSDSKLQATSNSFSNQIGSHKSSLGKYRVGKRRVINSVDGMFDVSMYNIPCYEMHGLEKTNSNAHKRGILIHPMPMIDIMAKNFPMPPGLSFGCFSVSKSAFDKLSSYINSSSTPVLLWAYYE